MRPVGCVREDFEVGCGNNELTRVQVGVPMCFFLLLLRPRSRAIILLCSRCRQTFRVFC